MSDGREEREEREKRSELEEKEDREDRIDHDQRSHIGIFQHRLRGVTKPEAADDDAPRRPSAEALRQSPERPLGPERGTREQDHVSGHELHQVPGLSENEVAGALDGMHTKLAPLHRRSIALLAPVVRAPCS